MRARAADAPREFPAAVPAAWGIGRIAPLLLAAWALLDVGLRLLPIGWLGINPVQVATRKPGRYSPFIPNLELYHAGLPGELALMANLPPSEARRPIRFTTDGLGFRATPGPPGKPVEVLVFEGDSFTFGAALSDDETLPAALARELGVRVYNGGRFFTDPERLVELDWLLDRLGNRPRTMLYVLMETVDLSAAADYDRGRVDEAGRRLLGASTYFEVKDNLRYANRFLRLWTQISPLGIVSQRTFKRLANDSIRPNSYKEHVEERRFPDGRRFLVEQRYVDRHLNPPDERTSRDTADYLAFFRDQVRARGLDFWVLLVPEALSVYEPWLLRAHEKVADRPAYLERLERQLQVRGLNVINGLTVLRPRAAEDVSAGNLSYFREDHHWTPLGVNRIAGAAASALRQTSVTSAQLSPERGSYGTTGGRDQRQ